MRNKTNVLLIEEGSSIITLRVIRCLGKTGRYRINVLSFSRKKMSSFSHSRFISSCKVHENADNEQTLDIILKSVRSTHSEIVIPLMEKQTKIIAKNFRAFEGLCRFPPLPDPSTLEIVIDKYRLAKWLFESGFSQTKPVNIQHLKEGQYNTDSIEYPLLIKPFWGSSGEGIIRINEPSELKQIIDSSLSTTEYLIQPYFPGNDLDLSALVEDGKILAFTMQHPVVENKKLKYSKKIEFTYDAELLDLCERIFRKLNFSGIAHLDFRYNPADHSYQLVDFNARYWSTITGSLKAGINFPDLACRRALNIKAEHKNYKLICFLSSESLFYILLNSFRPKSKSIQFLINNELYYGIRDPLSMFFNFITLIRAKIEWHLLRGKRKKGRL